MNSNSKRSFCTNLSASGIFVASDELHSSCLAGAVGAEEAEELAGLQLQVHAFERALRRRLRTAAATRTAAHLRRPLVLLLGAVEH